KKVYDDNLAKQKDIDNVTSLLKYEINKFEEAKNKTMKISEEKAVALVGNGMVDGYDGFHDIRVDHIEGNSYVVYAYHKYCDCGMWGDDYSEYYYVDMYTGAVRLKEY